MDQKASRVSKLPLRETNSTLAVKMRVVSSLILVGRAEYSTSTSTSTSHLD